MTVALSSLRIVPELDPSKYTAGAQQKVAADAAMRASSQSVGAAMTQTDAKISQAGDALARLSRQFVDGYAQSQRMESGLRSLNTQLETGKAGASQAAAIYEGMTQKLGRMASGADLAARGYMQLGAIVDRVNAKIAATPTPSRPAANQNFQGISAAYQVQDVLVQSAMGGVNPAMIGLMQGSQLGMGFQGQSAMEAAKGMGAAVTGLLNPVMLLSVGFTTALAAGAQYFMSSGNEAKSLAPLMEDHEKQIKRVTDLWGDAANARSRYGKESTASASFGLDTSISAMVKRLNEQRGEVGGLLSSAINGNLEASGLSNREFRGTTFFKVLQTDFDALYKATVAGSPDVLNLIRAIEEAGKNTNNAGIRAMAADAVTALQPFRELAHALREAAIERDRLFNDRGANGMLLSRGATNRGDMGNLALFDSQQAIAAQRREQEANAARLELYARSPQDQAAAARAREASRYDPSETPSVRAARIELAGVQVLERANHDLAEAQRDRMRALDNSMAQQQLEIGLIGKTAGEAAKLRMEFELSAQVREEAARNGVAADEAELKLIRQKAEEMGRLVDLQARLELGRNLQFEREQMFRSPLDQGIASRLRGSGLGLNSDEAQMMREMQQFADAKGMALSFLNTFKSALMDNGGDIGDALGKAILASLANSMDKQLSNIFDRLGTAFASWLTGMRSGGSAPALDFFPAAPQSAGVTRLLSPANSNAAPADLGNLLSRLGAGKAQSHITGMSDDLQSALSRMIEDAPGDITINSGFRSIARQKELFDAAVRKYGSVAAARKWVAPPGRSQHNMGNAADLGFEDASTRSWAHDNASNYGLKFPMKHEPWHIETMGARGGMQSFGAAERQIKALGDTAAKSVQGLTAFDGGLVDMAGKLTSPNGPLGGLFGTGLSNFQGFQDGRGGGLGALLGYGGGGAPQGGGAGFGGIFGMLLGFLPKLFGFAEGTDNAPPGMAWVGERGPEIVKFRGGEQVIPNHKLGGNQNAQPSKVDLHVHVAGASGDNHVRMLAKQGAQQAIGDYHEMMGRGGFGALQKQYQSQKAG